MKEETLLLSPNLPTKKQNMDRQRKGRDNLINRSMCIYTGYSVQTIKRTLEMYIYSSMNQ